MRTLFISNVIAERLHAGSYHRVLHLLQGVASVSDVTFVAATRDAQWQSKSDPFSPLCKEMHFFPRESFAGWNWNSQSAGTRQRKALGRLLGTADPELLQWHRSSVGTSLVSELCKQNFDLIWVEKFYSLSLLPAGLKARVIVDLDDLEHRRMIREVAVAKGGGKLVKLIEYLKLRRAEFKLPALPYEYVVCSETDKQVLSGGSNINVVPNGVDIPPSAGESSSQATDPILSFVGGMSGPPNIDAALFFVKDVLPLIRREIPKAKFLIIGRDPVPAIRELHDGQSVVVTGTVPDIEPYMRQSAVLVAPLRIGAGTRLKILEAMAHNRPVVTTTIGCEGLDVQSGGNILVADGPARFAAACVSLLRDREMARNIARNGLDLVTKKYQWSSIERGVGQIAAQNVKREDRREDPVCQAVGTH